MVDYMEFTKVMLILYQKNCYLEEIINCCMEEITNCYLEEIRKDLEPEKTTENFGHDLSHITGNAIVTSKCFDFGYFPTSWEVHSNFF